MRETTKVCDSGVLCSPQTHGQHITLIEISIMLSLIW